MWSNMITMFHTIDTETIIAFLQVMWWKWHHLILLAFFFLLSTDNEKKTCNNRSIFSFIGPLLLRNSTFEYNDAEMAFKNRHLWWAKLYNLSWRKKKWSDIGDINTLLAQDFQRSNERLTPLWYTNYQGDNYTCMLLLHLIKIFKFSFGRVHHKLQFYSHGVYRQLWIWLAYVLNKVS